jgi:hypothetical protein
MTWLTGSITKEKLAEVCIFCLLFISYAYVFPRWADPNQNSRLDMVVAVVDDGTFQIDSYVKNTVDYAKVGEHYFSDKAPGAAFVGIPVYWGVKNLLELPAINRFTDQLEKNEAFQATLNPEGSGISEQKVRFAIAQVLITLVVSALPTAFLGVLIFITLRLFTEHIGFRIFVSLAYGLLTPAFAYGGAFYGHQLSAALLFWAFSLTFTRRPLSKYVLLWIGFLLSYSVITEYPAALIAGAIGLYVCYVLFKQQRLVNILWLVPLGGSVLVLWMAYNNAIFGGPLHLGYSNSELWMGQHHTGFMSLSFPTWEGFWGISLGKFRGLFFYSPISLLFFPGMFLWWQGKKFRAEWFLVVFSVLSMFLFNSASIMWWGGFAVGPRYLLPMLPFMAVSWIFTLIKWRSKTLFWMAVGFMAAWSWIAVWGLTLAGRSFPSDTLYNPLIEYALPNWIEGNIARNGGTLLHLSGVSSLLLLAVLYFIIGVGLAWAAQKDKAVLVKNQHAEIK